MSFVKAFEHRCMAVGLPFVLHGLVSNDLAERCALAYLKWRMLLDCSIFTGMHQPGDQNVDGIGSLDQLQSSGELLQATMNELYSWNQGSEDEIEGTLHLPF